MHISHGVEPATQSASRGLTCLISAELRCTVHSKFPDNPDATYAFQKVAVAYDVLSKPASKRLYDSRSPSASYDAFATRPTGYAEETLRGVVLGVFNDFLDGDLEVIRTLLSALFIHLSLLHGINTNHV